MTWEITYIPGKLPCSIDQCTVDVFASLVEPKHANTIIRQLNQIAPIENLRHVKRVRKSCVEGNIQLSVIICLSHYCENKLEDIPDDIQKLMDMYKLSPFVAKVPRYEATSKKEWEEQCELWPTSYHPPTYNIEGITGFTDRDLEMIFTYMKMCLELAKSGHPSGKVVNAVTIVDPLNKQVIASAFDQTYLEFVPLCSSGVNLAEINGLAESFTCIPCLNPWKWADETPHERSNGWSWHPLRHACLVAIENSASRDRKLFPGSGCSKDQSVEMACISTSLDPSLKRQKTQQLKANNGDGVISKGLHSDVTRPYLCTGFDIFIVWEPCAMCAMALVHQRIRRIFYAFPNLKAGALGSVYRLQGEKSLNHHYAVFRVMVPEDFLHLKESLKVSCTNGHSTN